jgi:hypothetical protein
MEPNIWPLDAPAVVALVTRTVEAIDARDEADSDALLMNLLEAAWGNVAAQHQ